MSQAETKVWRSRAMIIGITLITFIPFALAWYYARHSELVESRSNYGNLFIPPVPLDVGQLIDQPVGRAERIADIRGRWVLLQVGEATCGADCAFVTHETHQVRLMLNKEIQRVRRVLLVPKRAAEESFGDLLARDDDLVIAAMPPGLMQTLHDVFGHPPAPDTVLLMDPLGNLALWYEPRFDPYKLLKDLKHLLKASQIG